MGTCLHLNIFPLKKIQNGNVCVSMSQRHRYYRLSSWSSLASFAQCLQSVDYSIVCICLTNVKLLVQGDLVGRWNNLSYQMTSSDFLKTFNVQDFKYTTLAHHCNYTQNANVPSIWYVNLSHKLQHIKLAHECDDTNQNIKPLLFCSPLNELNIFYILGYQ